MLKITRIVTGMFGNIINKNTFTIDDKNKLIYFTNRMQEIDDDYILSSPLIRHVNYYVDNSKVELNYFSLLKYLGN